MILITNDGSDIPAYRVLAHRHTTATAADAIPLVGIRRVLSASATANTALSDDLIGVTVQTTDATGDGWATATVSTWKNTSGSDPTPAAATSFGVPVSLLVAGIG